MPASPIFRPRFHSLALAAALAVAALAVASQPGFGQISESTAIVPLAATAPTPVPALVPYTGIAASRDGKPLTEPVPVTFLIYGGPQGGEALWSEVETVTPDSTGRFTVQLGSTLSSGLPSDLFLSGEARWLEVQIAGQNPRPRTLLTSVPYALKAADASTLGGMPASNFVTREQLESRFKATAAALAEQAIQPLLSGTVTGLGTTGTVPLWTGTLTQGNSEIVQVGSNVGINQASPTATLDVGGSENVRGILSLPAFGTATATAGQRSQLIQLSASGWSSTANAPVTPTFKLLTNVVNNNTGSPAGQFEFHYQNGPASVTVLSIGGNGVINFAPKQTFPGTIASVAATSPVTAKTTSGAVSLSLDTSALEATLNGVYPQLSAYNSFTSGASFGGETTWNGSSTDWMMVVTNQSAQSKGTLLAQAAGNMLGIEGASPGGAAIVGSTTTGMGITGQTYGEGGAAYLWSQANTVPNTQIVSAGQGDGLQITTHNGNALTSTSINGYGGLFSNNSTYQATVYASNSGAGNAGYFGNSSASRVALAGVNASTDPNAIATYGSAANGDGVYGTSTNGYGVYGTSTNGVGIYGTAQNYGVGLYGSSQNGDGIIATATNGIALVAASAASTVPVAHIVHNSGTIGLTSPWQDWASTAALWVDGELASGAPQGNYASLMATAGDEVAGVFRNNSQNSATIYAYNVQGNQVSTLFKVFQASSPDGTCGIGGAGNLSCTGQIKTLINAGGGTRRVETYAMQSPENWMEDFGSGALERGVAIVTIDPTFAETVSETSDYHVFITPNADSRGLYVIRKTATTFEVRESGGGTSSLSFDYRIVAKRRGFEAERHVDVTEQYRAAMERTVPKPKPAQGGEPIRRAIGEISPLGPNPKAP